MWQCLSTRDVLATNFLLHCLHLNLCFFRVNREGMPDSFSRFIVVGSLNPFFTTLLLLQHSHFVGLYDRTPLNIKCVCPFIFLFWRYDLILYFYLLFVVILWYNYSWQMSFLKYLGSLYILLDICLFVYRIRTTPEKGWFSLRV